MKYSDKLKDPRWQRLRLEVMNRDDFTCRSCNDRASTLNVHHKQYSGNPWDAPLEALETLCELCHERRGRANKLFLDLDTFQAIQWAMTIAEFMKKERANAGLIGQGP